MAERADMLPEDVRREAECFADYWQAAAGAKGRKADWQATWRNWVRRADGPRDITRSAPALNRQEALEESNRNVAAAWAAESMAEGAKHETI